MRALMLVSLIAASSYAAAESAKPLPAAHVPQDQQRPATLTLASNETGHSTVADAIQHGQPPVAHRIARVTTCRCGDPQPDPESDSEQQ